MGSTVKVSKPVAALLDGETDKVMQCIERGRLDACTPIPVSKQSKYWDGTPLPLGNKKAYLLVPLINYICFMKDITMLKALLDKSTNKKKMLALKDATHMSPLHIAAANDFVKGIPLLSEFGYDPKTMTDRGITPIMCAVSRTDPGETSMEMVNLMLLQADKDAINVQDRWGQTALHYATDDQWIEAVELLLAKGADVNIQDKAGHTPLFDVVGSSTYSHYKYFWYVVAADGRAKKGEQILQLLIKHKANVNVQDKDGATVLHRVVTKPDLDTFNSSFNHYVAMFETILHAGANIHIKDREGFTPLLMAVNYYNPRFVRELAKLHTPRQLSWRHKLEEEGDTHYTTALYLPIEKVEDIESQVRACYHIVQILVVAGHRIYSEVYKTVKQCSRFHFQYFKEILLVLEKYRMQPRELKDLSRLAIRNGMSDLRFGEIQKLPLPASLCRYVGLEDLDDIPVPGPPESPPKDAQFPEPE